MALDQQTQQRMRELFGGRQCCLCDSPAARLIDNAFYCHRHFYTARRESRARGPRPTSHIPTAPPAVADTQAG